MRRWAGRHALATLRASPLTAVWPLVIAACLNAFLPLRVAGGEIGALEPSTSAADGAPLTTHDAYEIRLLPPVWASPWRGDPARAAGNASQRLLLNDAPAEKIGRELQVIRLPPPVFNAAPSDGGGTADVLLDRAEERAPLPAELDDEPVDLLTPRSRAKQDEFLARVFGPGFEAGGEMLSSVPLDYQQFYSPRSLLWLGGGIGVAAVLANTSLDQNFQNWYQADVRSSTSDHIRDDIAWLGQGNIMLPLWATSSFLLTPLEEEIPAFEAVGTWGRKSLRAFVVGAPMLIALQYGLGAHRPNEEIDSQWHPFRDTHGASGDAWVGAIGFMTAAKMTDSRLAKVALYSMALVPAWGRVNVDAHYLSQATLGVWLAALSVEAVDVADRSTRMFIVPTSGPGGYGAAAGWRW